MQRSHDGARDIMQDFRMGVIKSTGRGSSFMPGLDRLPGSIGLGGSRGKPAHKSYLYRAREEG